MTAPGCPECGSQVPRLEGPGRPPRYCSPVCVRAAEYEVRRINAHLKRAESKLTDARCRLATDSWGKRSESADTKFWSAEVQRLKELLRSCLANGSMGDVVERPAS